MWPNRTKISRFGRDYFGQMAAAFIAQAAIVGNGKDEAIT